LKRKKLKSMSGLFQFILLSGAVHGERARGARIGKSGPGIRARWVLSSGEGRAPAGPGGRRGCMVNGQIDLSCSTARCVLIASIFFLRILHRLLVLLASRGSIRVQFYLFLHFFALLILIQFFGS
jgi:hypothetical protein